MAVKTWKVVKISYCDRARQEVSFDAEVVYPAEWLPDQPPRVLNHRCSRAARCNLLNIPVCLWSATNPSYDPFSKK